jgi:hypothetical protein
LTNPSRYGAGIRCGQTADLIHLATGIEPARDLSQFW